VKQQKINRTFNIFIKNYFFYFIDRGERICLHCTLNEVEDESHMLFKCPIYETERATLLTYIQDNYKNFEHLSPNNKLIWLLSNEDTLLFTMILMISNIHCI
jgi:hypothetical protein